MPTSQTSGSAVLVNFVEKLRAERTRLGGLDWSSSPPTAVPDNINRWQLAYKDPGAANRTRGKVLSLDEVREQIPMRAKHYIENKTDYSFILAVPPGVGKTHAAIEVVQWYVKKTGKRVLWAGQRHNMFDTLAEMPHFDHDLWYHWLPMRRDDEAPDDPVKTTCRYAHAQRQWTSKGYGSYTLCQSLCGGLDQHIKVCPYRAQAKRKERIIYAMHQHLSAGLAIDGFGLVIVDELPLQAFAEERIVSKDDIPLRDAIGPLKELSELLELAVAEMQDKGDEILSGRRLFDEIGKTLVDVYAQVEVTPDSVPVPPVVYRPEMVGNVQSWYVMDFLLAAAKGHMAWENDWEDWAQRVWVSKAGLHILKRSTPWDSLPKKMIVLDATANTGLYGSIFPDRAFKAYRPELKRAGKIFQIAGRLNGKARLLSGKGEPTQEAKDALGVAQLIAEQYRLRHPDKDKPRVGVICHKALTPLFERTFGESNINHFYNVRGANDMRTVDCLIVVGAPAPNMKTVINTATALDPDQQQPFAERRPDGSYKALLTDRECEYRVSNAFIEQMGGQTPYRKIKGFWEHRRLQAVYEQLREKELEQALHRARVNIRGCEVWMLTSVVTSEAVDGVYNNPPELAGVPERIEWKRWLKVRQHIDALEPGAEIGNEDLAEVGGVKVTTVRNQKWLDIIREQQGDQFEEVKLLRKVGAGRPSKGLKRTASAA